MVVGAAVTGTTGSLTKNGTGSLTLGAAATYTGVTTINGGTLRLGVDDAIATASATTVASGALLDLAGFDQTVGSLAGAGSVTSSASGAVLLTVGGNGVGTGTFSGVVDDGSGQVALTKIGSGTLTLSGVNTFSGRTTISAGGVSIAADSGLGTAPGSPAPGRLTIDTGHADHDGDVRPRQRPGHRAQHDGHVLGGERDDADVRRRRGWRRRARQDQHGHARARWP